MKIIIPIIFLITAGLAVAAITWTGDIGVDLARLSEKERREYLEPSKSLPLTEKTSFEKALQSANAGDYAAAFEKLKKLSDEGVPEATCALASLYLLGLGVDQSTKAARTLFEKAVDMNHPLAMLELAMLVEKEEPPEAFRLYQKAGRAGQPLANLKLGHCFETAGLGAPRNLKLAFSYYEKSANAGLWVAKGELGRCYDEGIGVASDPKHATKLYREAGLNGVSSAQLAMAQRYFAGKGVGKDPVEAVRWLQVASQNGSAAAQILLGDCCKKGEVVAQDYRKAGFYYSAAAKQGNAIGCQRLAALYRDGLGTPKDPVRAYVILAQAKEHPLIDKDLKEIVATLTPEQLKIAQTKLNALDSAKDSEKK